MEWRLCRRLRSFPICATASKDAPWFVVPADNKWFSRLVVAAAIVEAVEHLDLQYPKVTRIKERSSPQPAQSLSRKSRSTTQT
jgi:hypothetical protein